MEQNIDKEYFIIKIQKWYKKYIKNKNFINIACNIIQNTYEKKEKRNIWQNCKWKFIAELENDDVGKTGEKIIQMFCFYSNIESKIDGIETKKLCKSGDGIINGKSVEIKTARLGSSGLSFQHELGEEPWKSEFMLFLDISPNKMYITIFPNFTEDFYKKSGNDNKIKCNPYFSSKSITWRKKKGSFKLDTSIKINENNKFTFIIKNNKENNFIKFNHFVNSIITKS